MITNFRFSPPDDPLDHATIEVLLHALSVPLDTDTPVRSADQFWTLAGRLRLRERIASRHSQGSLLAAFGADVASLFHRCACRQLAQALAFRESEDTLLEASTSDGWHFVLLKSAAMRRFGLVSEISRPASDIDVLVRPQELQTVIASLAKFNYSLVEQRNASHHPVTLRAPSGIKAELHVCIPGIVVSSHTEPACFDDLISAQQLVRIGATSHAWLPTRDLLVAHMLVHGIAQHGFQPKTYPATRLLCDTIDLGLVEMPELVARAHALISREVTTDEVAALILLASRLNERIVPSLLDGNRLPALLLNHIVHSMLNDGYRSKLILQGVAKHVRDVGLVSAISDSLASAFLLPDASLRRLSGNRIHTRLGRRLVRPWQMLMRLASHTLKTLRQSRRSR